MKNVKRKVATGLTAFLIAISVSVVMDTKASAADPQFIDFDKEAIDTFSKTNWRAADVNTTDMQITDVTAEPVGEPLQFTQNVVLMGEAELENSSNESINQNIPTFKKDLTDSVTTTTIKGWKAEKGPVLSATVKDIFGLSSAFGEYNYSDSSPHRITSTSTYTYPEQNISIPAHTKAIATVYLQRVRGIGKVNLKATLSGRLAFIAPQKAAVKDVYDLFKEAKDKGYQMPSELTLDDEAKKVHFSGAGEWKAGYGLSYFVDINLVDQDTGKPKFINVDGSKKSSYRYTVPVKKEDVTVKNKKNAK
ncbi:toxin ETX/toxin MTX2 [Marininema mesophilum]|uniref:Toxin ETX/toxin MTX2 n=1 Tax=Marininema mesophilum TaxID=1048340 RepID=A0A1H2UUZ9_9BACL|nr:ETX/MTX2 family pore-forming toxin [Marininema mesophilum]SDW59960.1 toxin ETX/toxin MTX2 [Marininema mesophilum]